MDEVTWFVPFEGDLKHDRIVMRHGDDERVYVPERKPGKWIKHDTGHSIYYDCSLCGCVAPCTETADKILWKMANYCPDCGVKMEVEG